MPISRIPVDILLEILEETPQSDLSALCRVSKSFRHHASDFLYRDISTLNILGACATLTRSPDLAARVKHFEVSRPSTQNFASDDSKFALIGDALRCLPNLRSLSLRFFGKYSWMLTGCTFKIEQLVCFIVCDDQFVDFLNGQPELAAVRLSCPCRGLRILPICIPKLTKIQAQISWLAELLPGRPVKDVVFEEDSLSPPVPLDKSFSPSSWSAVRILSIRSSSLRIQPPAQIAPFIRALDHLTIDEHHIGVSLHDQATRSLMEWLRELLSVLPHLRSITLTTIRESFVWSDEDELDFLEDVTRLASSTLKTFILDYPPYPSVCTTWVRANHAWTIGHRERQEPWIDKMLELKREARKQKWIAELAAHYQALRSSSAQTPAQKVA